MTPTPEDLEDAKNLYDGLVRMAETTLLISPRYAFLAAHIARIRSEAEAKGRAEAFDEAAKEFRSRSEKEGSWHGSDWCCNNANTSGRESAHESDAYWCEDRAAAERAKRKEIL